jgi:Glycosyl hydrolases family 25
MTKRGADISHHQATFDADHYYAAEDFLVLKATEAGGFTDPAFRSRWQAAGSRPRGAYHFARPGGAQVDAQADHFIATVRACGWRAGDVWVLDMEDGGGLGPASLVTWSDRWCSRVRAALGGRGLFYSYPFFVRDTMGDPGRIPGGCLGWWARYAATPYGGLFRPPGWPDPPDVWQCSNGEIGCVKAIASVGRCDYNQMTDTAFAALFGGQEVLDMYDAEAEARLFKRLEEAERKVARWVDHGDPAVTGSGSHHEKIRAELAAFKEAVGLRLDALEEVAGRVTLDLSQASPQQLTDLGKAIADHLQIGGHPSMTGTITLAAQPPA